MTTQSFEKQPGEQYPISFNYYGKLPGGAKLVTAQASAIDVAAPEVDASLDVLQSTVAIVKGSLVKVGVKGGDAGKSYRITVIAFLSTAENDNLRDECLMNVVGA